MDYELVETAGDFKDFRRVHARAGDRSPLEDFVAPGVEWEPVAGIDPDVERVVVAVPETVSLSRLAHERLEKHVQLTAP